MQVKLFPYFTSLPFEYLLIIIMSDELSLQLWIFEMFILDRTIEDKNSQKLRV